MVQNTDGVKFDEITLMLYFKTRVDPDSTKFCAVKVIDPDDLLTHCLRPGDRD